MPNHMHSIIELTDRATTPAGSRAALGKIIRAFKAVTSYQIRHAEGQLWFAWQDDFYDMIIRTETALQQIRRYIHDNPICWSQDKLYRRY